MAEKSRPMQQAPPGPLVSRSAVTRLVETFFRRWYLYAALFLLFCAAGAASVASSPKQYQSVGVLNASTETLLAGLSDVSIQTPFTWETPANFTSRTINERLQTTSFARTVADNAGLGRALETGAMDLAEIRSSVTAAAQGNNLLNVQATHTDPQVAFRLASSTIESFVEAVVDDDLAQSNVAEGFYQNLADSYAEQVDEARTMLTTYLAENPQPPGQPRSESERAQLDQLEASLTRAETLYLDAVSRAEAAALVAEQTRLDVSQRLRLVDAPDMPSFPISGLRATALTIMLYLTLGSLVTMTAVALVSFFDRTIRHVDDVEALPGVDALAAVPKARRSSRGTDDPSTGQRGRRTGRRRGRRSTMRGLSVNNRDGELMHLVQPEVADRLRYLLERLRGAGGIPRRLSLVSALSGEGVTHLTRSLAAVLAHDTGHRVCVVELNWWKPSVAPRNEQGLGIADAVFWQKSVDDILIPTDDPNLWFLPAGDLDEAQRPTVAHDDRLAIVMAEVAERFDHLVLDLPAVLATSDSMALARLSDQFALVVHHGATTQSQILEALDQLEAVPCAGIALNFAKTKTPRIVRRYLGA